MDNAQGRRNFFACFSEQDCGLGHQHGCKVKENGGVREHRTNG